MVKIKLDKYEDLSSFLKDEKNYFFEVIINAIKKGWKNKLDKVTVAEFLISESETTIIIDMERDDWEESLYLALYHYEEMEEYEKCIDLKGLIKNIYGIEDKND